MLLLWLFLIYYIDCFNTMNGYTPGSYIVTGACEETAVSVLSSNTGTLVTRYDMFPNRRLPGLYVQVSSLRINHCSLFNS